MRTNIARVGLSRPAPYRGALLRRIGALCAILVLATSLGGCVFAIPGSSTPTAVLEEQQYFAQATQLQSDATKCPTTSCKDAELTAAVQVYERILKLDPLNKFAYYDIGVIYTQSGQSSPASIALQKALLIDADYFPALYNLAYLDASGGDDKDAMSLYSEASKATDASNAERAKAYFNLGYLYDTNNRKMDGDAAFEEAVNLDPALATRIPAKDVPPGLSATSVTGTGSS